MKKRPILFLLFLSIFIHACGTNVETSQRLVVSLEMPLSTLSSETRRLEEIEIYRFFFETENWKSGFRDVYRKSIEKAEFNDIPHSRNLIMKVQALDKEENPILEGEQIFDFTSGKQGKIFLKWIRNDS